MEILFTSSDIYAVRRTYIIHSHWPLLKKWKWGKFGSGVFDGAGSVYETCKFLLVRRTLVTMCNGEGGNFVIVKN